MAVPLVTNEVETKGDHNISKKDGEEKENTPTYIGGLFSRDTMRDGRHGEPGEEDMRYTPKEDNTGSTNNLAGYDDTRFPRTRMDRGTGTTRGTVPRTKNECPTGNRMDRDISALMVQKK